MKKNVVLIGFMGTGKSSVGRRLAKILKMDFVDTDAEIEKLTGLTVAQIFARHGEKRFRSEEELIVKKVARRQNCVIATGGGVVLNPENVKNLKETGVIICLTAEPETILERVKRRNTRPLLPRGSTVERVNELMEQRRAYYEAAADYTVDTTHLTREEVVKEILKLLEKGDMKCEEPSG
ncbi:shikimate kinase [Calderihabitans maritimus]|uniref:Shikimate kinase n=1 Tax=Calderihabitans maritimus TaxID=1246530 RepID=A0A1Z5HX72_9FIRM|nr:shikimate kinase [Calderihabitans maritimus]GAW94126.1 shikimate kinase [Calderihabitans maritimus]